MTLPKLNRDVTVGNVISWTMIIIGFVVGYTKLQDASAQTVKDVTDAKVMSTKNKDDIGDLKTDIAVIKTNVITINEKIDEIRSYQRSHP